MRGNAGPAFSVVANEVRTVAGEIEGLVSGLGNALGDGVDNLTQAVEHLASETRSAAVSILPSTPSRSSTGTSTSAHAT